MNSSTKNPKKRTLYCILPFIVVLLSSTIVFGEQTSFPITITSPVQTTGGNMKLQNVTSHFSGTIDLFYPPNADGCYVSFSGDDGTTICITSIYEASAETNRNVRPRGSDPTRMVGTGRIVIPLGGVGEQGIVYIDVNGTRKYDPSKETLLFNGKIGGGGPDFVLTGSFKSTFVYFSE